MIKILFHKMGSTLHKLLGRILYSSYADRLMHNYRYARFPFMFRRLSGPRSVSLGPDDVVVVCPVRDGAPWVKNFLEHYRSLNVAHFVLLDNGSVDGTLDLLKDQPDVTLLQTSAPFKYYKFVMKQYLVKKWGKNNWVLCVDIDELFDYPLRGGRGLRPLITYLNRYKHSAVVAHMLDLFPAAEGAGASPDWRSTHIFYNIDDVQKLPYAEMDPENNVVSWEGVQFFLGGIRKTKFGVAPFLSKHPLVFPARGADFFHIHHIRGAVVADVSTVLLHYKYVGDFVGRFQSAVKEGQYWNGSEEYVAYMNVLSKDSSFAMFDANSRRIHTVDQLLDEKFLVASPVYRSEIAQDKAPENRNREFTKV